MKLLTTIISLIISTLAFSQVCTPDPDASGAGTYPKSETGIADAIVGIDYNQTITVIVPEDTTIVFNGSEVNVMFDSAILVELLGTPAWFKVDCNNPTCMFPGGEKSCALFKGFPNDTGTYVIDLVTKSYGNASGFPITQTDTSKGYYTLSVQEGELNLRINEPHSPSISYQNGWINATHLTSTSGTLEVHDLTGRKVLYQSFNDEQIQAPFTPSTSGLFIVTLQLSDGSKISHRILVP